MIFELFLFHTIEISAMILLDSLAVPYVILVYEANLP